MTKAEKDLLGYIAQRLRSIHKQLKGYGTSADAMTVEWAAGELVRMAEKEEGE